MRLKTFITVCVLWFLVGLFFGGALFGTLYYRYGQNKAYKYLHEEYENQNRYDSLFDRTA